MYSIDACKNRTLHIRTKRKLFAYLLKGYDLNFIIKEKRIIKLKTRHKQRLIVLNYENEIYSVVIQDRNKFELIKLILVFIIMRIVM